MRSAINGLFFEFKKGEEMNLKIKIGFLFSFFLVSTCGAQDITFDQAMNAIKKMLSQNKYWDKAFAATDDINLYAKCSMFGTKIAALDYQGNKFSNETKFSAASFLVIGDMYQSYKVRQGVPKDAVGRVFDSYKEEFRNLSQESFNKNMQYCMSSVNSLLSQSKDNAVQPL
jgi:hypothetical protein